MQTLHCIRPVLVALTILTSQDRSWLQKGQLKLVSSGSIALRFWGALRLDLRRPMAGQGTGEAADKTEEASMTSWSKSLVLFLNKSVASYKLANGIKK